MIKHLWLVSFRFLYRNKFISSICTLTIVLATLASSPFLNGIYLEYTRDYNLIHKKLTYSLHAKNKDGTLNNPHYPIYSILQEFPEIKIFTRNQSNGFLDSKQISYQLPNNNWVNISSGHFIYVDPSYFDIFDINFTNSFQKKQFKESNVVLVSEDIALNLFNHLDIIGEVIVFDRQYSLKIIGLYKKVPNRSSPDLIISRQTLDRALKDKDSEWFWFGNDSYQMVLNPQTDPTHLSSKINDHLQSQNRLFPDHSYEISVFPKPLNQSDIIFSLALFFGIVVVALSNYINLTAGFTEKLIRELGMRRILGSPQKHLITRLFIQHIIILSFACLIAISIITPFYRSLGENITLDTPTILFLLSFIPITLFLAVLYPSITFSKLNPLTVIRSGYSHGRSRTYSAYRSVLIVLQLALSLVLIINTNLFDQYTNDLKKKEKGWKAHNILSVEFPNDDLSKINFFINELNQKADIKGITRGSGIPITSYQYSFDFPSLRISKESSINVQSGIWYIDKDYFDFFGLELTAGKSPSEQLVKGIWITETLARELGIENNHNSLGNSIELLDDPNGEMEVISVYILQGVISDYINDLESGKSRPNAFIYDPSRSNTVFVSYNTGSKNAVTENMSAIFQSLYPDWYVNVIDIEKNIESWGVIFMRDIFGFVGVIAFSMTILGIFGLLIQIGIQHKKEFCIRMVFGCLRKDMFTLFLKKFSVILFSSLLFGLAVFYMQLDIVLSMVPEKVTISILSIAKGLTVIVGVVVVLITFQVLRIYHEKPAEILKE